MAPRGQPSQPREMNLRSDKTTSNNSSNDDDPPTKWPVIPPSSEYITYRKPDDTQPGILYTKPAAPKPKALKPRIPEPVAPEQETPESGTPQPEIAEADIPEPEVPKPVVPDSESGPRTRAGSKRKSSDAQSTPEPASKKRKTVEIEPKTPEHYRIDGVTPWIDGVDKKTPPKAKEAAASKSSTPTAKSAGPGKAKSKGKSRAGRKSGPNKSGRRSTLHPGEDDSEDEGNRAVINQKQEIIKAARARQNELKKFFAAVSSHQSEMLMKLSERPLTDLINQPTGHTKHPEYEPTLEALKARRDDFEESVRARYALQVAHAEKEFEMNKDLLEQTLRQHIANARSDHYTGAQGDISLLHNAHTQAMDDEGTQPDEEVDYFPNYHENPVDPPRGYNSLKITDEKPFNSLLKGAEELARQEVITEEILGPVRESLRRENESKRQESLMRSTQTVDALADEANRRINEMALKASDIKGYLTPTHFRHHEAPAYGLSTLADIADWVHSNHPNRSYNYHPLSPGHHFPAEELQYGPMPGTNVQRASGTAEQTTMPPPAVPANRPRVPQIDTNTHQRIRPRPTSATILNGNGPMSAGSRPTSATILNGNGPMSAGSRPTSAQILNGNGPMSAGYQLGRSQSSNVLPSPSTSTPAISSGPGQPIAPAPPRRLSMPMAPPTARPAASSASATGPTFRHSSYSSIQQPAAASRAGSASTTPTGENRQFIFQSPTTTAAAAARASPSSSWLPAGTMPLGVRPPASAGSPGPGTMTSFPVSGVRAAPPAIPYAAPGPAGSGRVALPAVVAPGGGQIMSTSSSSSSSLVASAPAPGSGVASPGVVGGHIGKMPVQFINNTQESTRARAVKKAEKRRQEEEERRKRLEERERGEGVVGGVGGGLVGTGRRLMPKT